MEENKRNKIPIKRTKQSADTKKPKQENLSPKENIPKKTQFSYKIKKFCKNNETNSISSKKTNTSSISQNNNLNNNNITKTFIYKKKMNPQKAIAINQIKNFKKENINIKTQNSKKTLTHCSSSGQIPNSILRTNYNSYDENYNNIHSHEHSFTCHRPKKKFQKFFMPHPQINPVQLTAVHNPFKVDSVFYYDLSNAGRQTQNYPDKTFNNFNYFYDMQNIPKKSEFINIEDLLLLEENFHQVLKAVKTNDNISNICFEFINIYKTSSLSDNFDNYFKDVNPKIIVHTSIMLIIYNIIITYHISFDQQFLNSCYEFLISLITMNHNSFLLICSLISMKVSSSAQENIWVKKLRKMLNENLKKHLGLNDKDFVNYLTTNNLTITKNITIDSLIEIKFYSSQIKKYLKLLLNTFNNTDKLKLPFCEILKNINLITFEKLNFFYKKNVIRIINKNASVTDIDASFYGNFPICKIQAPYITKPLQKKFSLVLDLDETLIALKINPNEENKGLLKFRPGLDSFLLKVKQYYEIIVFTSATKEYADPIEDAIEQNIKYFDERLYRDHTIVCENDFVKDISRIGRPLDKILIVDNMPQNFRLQKENGIFIKAFWGEDIYDTALFSLGDILEKIYNQFNDVRKGIHYYKDEILNKVTSNFARRENNNNK